MYLNRNTFSTYAARTFLMLTFMLFFSQMLSASGPTVPTNIVAYVPITLNNAQNVGVPANFVQELTVNSVAYNSLEATTLNNIEFFFPNGTVARSWLEGNTLNPAQTSLIKLTNTIYWVALPASFLPASSSNTIYLGFANTLVNLFSIPSNVGKLHSSAPPMRCTMTEQMSLRSMITLREPLLTPGSGMP